VSTVVYRNAYFWLNGVDYSADIAELTLNYGSEMLDETAMGDDTRISKGGLKTWSVDAKAHQDFAAAHVGANLFALVGTTTCFELRPLNSCSTAINPSFSGVGILVNAPPVGGGVGTLLDMSFSLQNAGSLSRASSS
jgi:hypothetical protein